MLIPETLDFEIPPGHFLTEKMDPDHGDIKTIFNKDNTDDVAAARAQFEELVRKKGYLAYKAVGKEGTKGEMVREFDPDVERLIYIPPIRGG